MPEFRKDPVTGRWVIISTGRGSRPKEYSTIIQQHSHLASPFAPGNESMTPPEVLAFRPENSMANAPGWSLRVVPNKYPVLNGHAADDEGEHTAGGLFEKFAGTGIHEVIIETTEVDGDLPELEIDQIFDILKAYRSRILHWRKDTRWKYVQLFKNHGFLAGATLRHPHSQLLALPMVPPVIQEEWHAAESYYKSHQRCIFCDLCQQELNKNIRVIYEGKSYIVIAAFAARFPYESWIIPRHHHSHFEKTDDTALRELAETISDFMTRLRIVIPETAYNLVYHTSPLQAPDSDHYHWHIEVLPRSALIAGFEQGSGIYINATSPEAAARQLKGTVKQSLSTRGI